MWQTRQVSGAERENLSRQYARTRDASLRERVLLQHQGLVRGLARRFLETGEAMEDLVQVGNIGLIHALDRYDPGQGVRFSTYATLTIAGEIKRHLRDRGGLLKIPRWLQERQRAARRAAEQIRGRTGRAPTITQLAAHLGVTEEETLEALQSAAAMTAVSLDTQTAFGAHDSPCLYDVLGREDPALERFDIRGDLDRALAALNARERRVISLRFFARMSQSRIASVLNVSQMQVSRLERRALLRLRARLSRDGGPSVRPPAARRGGRGRGNPCPAPEDPPPGQARGARR